ncbi:MAG: c-type cytochrome [Terriglobia bacterium]
MVRHCQVNRRAQFYVQKGCAGCHGPTGSGGRAPNLIRAEGMPANPAPGRMAGMEMGAPGIIAGQAGERHA